MNRVEKQDVRFELSHALQRSLDIKDTLHSFYRALQTQVACGGMRYEFPDKQIQVHCGAERKHKANYTLRLKDQYMGELILMRSQPFSNEELARLEALLGILILPLRNALLYREAVENSLRDSLTRVGNRAAFEMAIQRELEVCRRSGKQFSLLMMDIDLFKRINDQAGHDAGDRVLQVTADTLRNTLRQTDQVFRYGGDEFIAILGNTSNADALFIAERLRQAMKQQPSPLADNSLKLTVSIGAGSSEETDNRNSVFQRTDDALFRAKSNGRDCIVSANLIDYESSSIPLD